MNFNTDGFNERTNYIYNSNDKRKLNNMSHNYDNSLVNMRINENKPDIYTVNHDKEIKEEEARGLKENFVLRNNNMNIVNTKPKADNPVANALNRNMFKR